MYGHNHICADKFADIYYQAVAFLRAYIFHFLPFLLPAVYINNILFTEDSSEFLEHRRVDIRAVRIGLTDIFFRVAIVEIHRLIAVKEVEDSLGALDLGAGFTRKAQEESGRFCGLFLRLSSGI